MGGIKTIARKTLEGMGYKVERNRPELETDNILLGFHKEHGVNLIFDIGANTGQYAQHLRQRGFTGKIISFEPIAAAYKELEAAAANDPNWITVHAAVGDTDGESEINIAANSVSSSILDMNQRHVDAAPYSAYVGKETIRVVRLDTVFDEYVKPTDKAFLKIDAQGFTDHILNGAEQSLKKLVGLYSELSCVTLYDGEPLIGSVVKRLEDAGFRLWFFNFEFGDSATHQMLQVNGTFYRI